MQPRFLLLILLLILTGLNAVSQNSTYAYPVPAEFRKAVAHQTRTLSGIPGRNYWQNTTDYIIDAALDVKNFSIIGSLTAIYQNNSPDTLDRLVFNLYQDIFRKGNSRDWDIGVKDLHDGMHISKLSIDNVLIDIKNAGTISRQGTKLVVNKLRLYPGKNYKVELEWKTKLPVNRTIRMGKYSDSVMFVAYWYPQIAVYDDIDGWDMISYGGSVEFYQDINNYKVRLKVPADFMVWATGFVQNPEEVFSDQVLSRYQAALKSMDVVNIIKEDDLKKMDQISPVRQKTWKYEARGVPDFSFGVAKGHLWDAVLVQTDSVNKRYTFIESVYPPGAPHWSNVVVYAAQAARDMSFRHPGYPFPYPKMTNFCNGRPSGGMETPMMANNSAPVDAANLFGLTYHEMAHSYFPFYMGTNEKKYAWMDEGFASIWPAFMVDSLFSDYGYLERTISTFQNFAGKEMDIPPMIPNQLLSANYSALRHSSYVRPAIAFHFLERLLGSELYTQALFLFMEQWKGKHPHPLDFFKSLENITDTDLAWFINPWFYDQAYPDLAIRKITKDRKIVIENIGGLPLPVELTITFTDGSQVYYSMPVDVWQMNNKHAIAEIEGNKPIREVILGHSLIPDSWLDNNKLLMLD